MQRGLKKKKKKRGSPEKKRGERTCPKQEMVPIWGIHKKKKKTHSWGIPFPGGSSGDGSGGGREKVMLKREKEKDALSESKVIQKTWQRNFQKKKGHKKKGTNEKKVGLFPEEGGIFDT